MGATHGCHVPNLVRKKCESCDGWHLHVWFYLKGHAMKMNSIHMHAQPKSRRLLSMPSSARGLCFLLLLGYCTLAVGQVDHSTAASSPFVDPATLDRSIPTPSSVIGHEVGEKAVRYDPLMRYLEVLAASSDRIVLKPYGETHEGRTLVHLFITSAKNHQRLDQIKEDNAKLTDPRKLANAAAGTELIENHPRDRKFLSFHPRLARRSGPFWSPRASTGGWSCLPNRQRPVAGGDCPGTTTSNSAP